jgi:hypothetical protein
MVDDVLGDEYSAEYHYQLFGHGTTTVGCDAIQIQHIYYWFNPNGTVELCMVSWI